MKLTRREVLAKWGSAGLALAAGGMTAASPGRFSLGAAHPEGPVGLAICVGLNVVDHANYYKGWTILDLGGCVNDAEFMSHLAHEHGYLVRKILRNEATTRNVKSWIERAAAGLVEGDILLVSFAGHGGQMRDENGDERNEDGKDETWCLFDRQIVDDELAFLWSKFRRGVRIIVVSDSCNSGSVFRFAQMQQSLSAIEGEVKVQAVFAKEFNDEVGKKILTEEQPDVVAARVTGAIKKLPLDAKSAVPGSAADQATYISRAMPEYVQERMDKLHEDLHREIQRAVPSQRVSQDQTKASVILLSACADGRQAMDLGNGGLYTAKLRQVWNRGQFAGTHMALTSQVAPLVERVVPSQVPGFRKMGVESSAFDGQRAFRIMT